MSTTKKKRLALKKKSPVKTATIISMFKQQTARQAEADKNKRHTEESGSEGDVIITDVVGLANVKPKIQTLDTNRGPAEGCSHVNKLRLSGRKRKLDTLSDTVLSKSSKPSNTNKSVNDLHAPENSVEKPKQKLSNHIAEVASDTKMHTTPYKLRQRKTVAIVDLSDSDTETKQMFGDNHDLPNVVKPKELENNIEYENTKKEKLEIGKSANKKLDDNVILINSNKDKIKSEYFELDKKGQSANARKKLSLKKMKSDADSQYTNKYSKLNEKETEQKCEQTVINDKGENVGKKNKSSSLHPKTAVSVDPIKYKDRNTFKGNLCSSKSDAVSKDDCEGTNDVTVCSDSQKENVRQHSSSVDLSGNLETTIEVVPAQRHLWCNKDNTETFTKTDNEDTETVDGLNVDTDVNKETKGEDTIENESPRNNEVPEFKVPYYLENFKTIMTSVLGDEENARLFDEDDMSFVSVINNMEESCQKLYVRLFSRKLAWLPMSKINYPEIGDDIPQHVDTLVERGLLLSEASLFDLPTVLKLLSSSDLKILAKTFHINAGGLSKQKIIEQMLKKGQQSSISTMFKGGNTGNMENTILKRAKGYLGKACKLQEEPRAVFIRILMLFSLYNTNFDEDSAGGGQNQLFQMLMANIGKVVYPTYTVRRERSVFKDRASLVRFETGLQFELDIQANIEKGRWSEAYEIYKQAKEIGTPVCRNTDYQSWDRNLPQFLRLYTAGSVYTRIDNLGVEILQRLKQYKCAVKLLHELLEQDLYCEHYRGHWYERLALNLEAHLKSAEKSLSVLEQGLSDNTVRAGRRFALYERARKLCEAPKSKYAERLKELHHNIVLPTPEVKIEGMVISDATSMGMKYQFVMQGDSDSVTLCAVEELVLDHYKQNGYPEGLHAEGSIVSNLFVLFFWDIMFMDVPDVFHGPFQTCPLDIATQDFYANRKQRVDDRLQWVQDASLQDLIEEVGRVWEEREGTVCAGINWEKFSGPDTHQRLVSCMGGSVIARILERYVKDPRHTRSGFPDLTLWNADTKQFKICEVKGPHDRLSHKQILWIDYLLKLGVDAEVCYVTAVGSKKLKPGKN